MAHEAAPEEVFQSEFNFAYFYLNPTFSDVTIRIGDEEIFAHKNILSCGSGYFREILLEKDDLKVVTLEDVTTSHFKELLKIIYTGRMEINDENLYELIDLVERFKIEFIAKELYDNFQKLLGIENCCQILNRVVSASNFPKSLKEKLLLFMNETATQLIDGNHIITLSQEAAVCFLSQDALALKENKILEAIENWRNHNKDPDELVAKCLRLSRFTRKELISLVRQCDFIDKINFLQVLEDIENKTLIVEDRINSLSSGVWNENIATEELGTKVLHGVNTRNIFSTNFYSINQYDWPSQMQFDPNGITIELGSFYSFNHIKFRLRSGSWYSYYIEISDNNQNWNRIIDYSQFHCSSIQNLYFDEVSAKYIRFFGVQNSSCLQSLFMACVEIMLKKEKVQVISGLIRPIENVATKDKGAIVSGSGRFGEDKLLNGDTRQVESNWTACSIAPNGGCILIQLAQPFLLSSCRLLLFKDYKYRYFIETSTNNKDWQIVVDRRNQDCSGWQYVEFKEKAVVYFKIRGTYSSESVMMNGYTYTYFKCIHFACPVEKPVL